jgi:hypothetical protein
MRNCILVIASIIILQGCGGSKKNNPSPSPKKAVLTSPAQNAICTTGTIISNTESSILFTWNASPNTNSYDLVLKNLLTSASTTQSTTGTQLTVTLARNTPYSWYIVSKSTLSGATAESDKWKFYNAGPGTITYAPFPVEITSPTFGQNITASSGTINLTWKGSSVNPGTITGYDVYFGTTNNPSVLKNAVTDMFINGVPVASKTTYYWKVITWDIDGNSSDSGVTQFTVN